MDPIDVVLTILAIAGFVAALAFIFAWMEDS